MENLKIKKNNPSSSLNFCSICESVINLLSDGILILDKDGYPILANPSFKKMFNLKEEINNQHFEKLLMHPELVELIKKHFSEKKELAKEIEINREEKTFYYTVRILPLFFENNFIASVVIIRDITKIIQLENVRKEFVANVSHELKTPLTAIKGYVETLLDGDLKDPELTKNFLEIIKNQTNRFILLVEDLLTLSRIEFKDIKVVKRWVLIEKIIDEAFDLVKDKASQKGLVLKKEIKTHEKIYTDPDRLSQILINLVDNAVKFTKKGEVVVKFYKNNDEFILEVKDTGIGIPKKFLHKIGERFFRVDPSRSRKRGGTGLGMAIVKHLVKLLNYRMKIESEEGKGTTVKIFIPSSGK